MAPNLGLLQAIGDPFNPEPVEREDAKFEFQKDPAIKVLLENPFIDPQLKKSLAEQELQRRRQAKIQFEIQAIKNRQRAEEMNQGVVSFLGPVPIGFQFGTAHQIGGPITQFLIDVVADPINLVSGVGALTKLGRASKFLKGVSAADKADAIIGGAKLLAKSNVDDSLRFAIREAIDNNKPKEIVRAFRKVRNSKLSKKEIDALREAGADAEFIDLITSKKADLKGLKAFFELKDKKEIGQLKEKFFDRVVEGQQGLINFRFPFTDRESSIRFPNLIKAIQGDTKPAQKAIDKAIKTAKSGGGEVGQELGREVAEVIGSFREPALKAVRDNLDPTDNLTAQNIAKDAMDFVRKSVSGEFALTSIFPASVRNVARLINKGMADTMTKFGIPFERVVQRQLQSVENAATQFRMTFENAFKGDADKLKRLSFAMEQPDLPKSKEFFESLTDVERNIVDEAGELIEDMGQEAKKFGAISDMLDNYVPHILEATSPEHEKTLDKVRNHLNRKLFKDLTGDGVQKLGVRRKLPKSRHGIKRIYDTMEEIVKLQEQGRLKGLRLKTTNFAELMESYIRVTGRAVARNQALTSLQGLKSARDGLPLVLRVAKNFDSGANVRSLRKRTDLFTRNAESYEELKDIPTFDQFRFHKDIHKQMRSLFGKDFIQTTRLDNTLTSKALQGIQYVNNLAKGTLLSLSPFFHAVNTGIYSNGALLPPAAAISANIDVGRHLRLAIGNEDVARDQILKMLMSAASPPEVLQQLARTQPAEVQSLIGLNRSDLLQRAMSVMSFGRVKSDQGFHTFNKFLESIGDVLPQALADPIVRGAKHVNNLSDKFLWNFMRDGHMLHGWIHMRTKEILRDPSILQRPKDLLKMEMEIADIAANAYGGVLERLFVEPNFKRISRLLMLAPDWTLANVKMAADAFFNLPGIRETAIGRKFTSDALMSDVRFRWAMGYQMRAFTYLFIGGNVLNYMFTGATGEAKWLWENPEDARDEENGFKRIELPWTRHDGRKQFMDVSKQFTEPIEMLKSPLKFFNSKLGPIPRIFSSAVVGVDSFGNPTYGDPSGPYAEIIERIANTSGQFVPIPVKGAVDAARGFRAPASVALNFLGGVSIRSESRDAFRDRQKLAELQAELRQGVDI